MSGSLAHRLTDGAGQIAPALALAVAVLVIGAFWLAEVGVAGALRAGAQSAGDAAALAAAAEWRHQAEQVLREGAGGRIDLVGPDRSRADAAARSYAARNDATVVRGPEFALREVRVEVESNRAMGSRSADDIGVSGTRGEAAARARYATRWRLPLPGVRDRTAPLSQAEIDAIVERNGFDPEETPAHTALRYPSGCNPGPDVKNLDARLHDVIIQLEMGAGGLGSNLVLVDGYRRPGCGGAFDQGLRLYAPENYGDALRVAPSQRGAVAARQASVGVCRPYPGGDPGLFALRTSHVCAGRVGDLTPRQVYGGSLHGVVRFEVQLIPDRGALGAGG